MHYTVRYAKVRPGLRGDWNETVWTRANTLEIGSIRPESSDHHPRTLARLLYDETGLYGFFKVHDQYVRCAHVGYMAPTYLDSCVEIFLEPKDGSGYLNFEFSCGGSLLCFHIIDPKRIPGGFSDYKPLPEADLQQVLIYHSLPSLVEPEIVEPIEWCLEYFIPFSILEKRVGPLGTISGQQWRANLYKCGDGTSHPHWISWAPIDDLDFHLSHCFGTIRFEESPPRNPSRIDFNEELSNTEETQ
jgi:hypothetical protein